MGGSNLNIAIVEDDSNISDLIYQTINEIYPNIKSVVFKNAKDALNYAKVNNIDIFLLDIQLNDYKGTLLAKEIREIDKYKYIPIVFITALANEELYAYRELKTYSFLTKPFTKYELSETLKDVIEYKKHLNPENKKLKIKQKLFIFEYDIKDILYIESFGKKLEIHLKKASDIISGYSLKSILEIIDDTSFIQCHKSYIINKNYIEKIDKSKKIIYLNDSNKIPIGKKFEHYVL